ncbi:MAG TPA: SPOR domain-containing protein [Casimicrobiaceae bacterium]|nr:SPOR domain-containing protein [Casimicrobiaceae bacterium]
MADAREPELDELRKRARRRLVGAIVLALAAAVLVPMLLESEPKPLGEDVSVKIPPVDDSKFVTKLGERNRVNETALAKPKPPPVVAQAEPSTPASPPKEPAKEASSSATVVKETPPVTASAQESKPPAPKMAPAETPASDPSKATKPATGPFSVQLAAFSDDKGANALASRLKKSGHAAYTEPYTSSRGTLYRVRVGPFASREAAETARDRLKADGQNGIIAAGN